MSILSSEAGTGQARLTSHDLELNRRSRRQVVKCLSLMRGLAEEAERALSAKGKERGAHVEVVAAWREKQANVVSAQKLQHAQ